MLLRNFFTRTALKQVVTFCFTFLFTVLSHSAYAQFEAPEFEKVTLENSAQFSQQFSDIKWTGRGLNQQTKLDERQTNEIRARLEAAFGEPTKTLEDLIDQEGFRPGKAIQFEYWFTVDDSIPMMVLDWDGPFGRGLTFAGASKYIDLMPQIKRALSQKLMSVEALGNFQDYYYSPERKQWFRVAYQDGSYTTKEIDSPEGMKIQYDY